MKWTDDQQKAIEARKGTLLVSAAAGSGKTAVLVERVIQRICDTSDPCGVENLLIVTFTNAAAAQMKEKIAAALSRKTTEFPSDKHLRRQQLMLPCASICTIDSFCIGLVRENFHALGIAPDFAMLDNGRINILKDTAINKVIDERHKNPTKEFTDLCDLAGNTSDDKKLMSAVMRLYELSRAYPFPELWLDSLTKDFDSSVPVEESPWGRILINHAIRTACSAKESALFCLSLLEDEPELAAKYSEMFHLDIAVIDSFLDKLSENSWDEICRSFGNLTFEKGKNAPPKYESLGKKICSELRKEYRKNIGDLKKIFGISSADHRSDIEKLSPIVSELIGLVKDFGAEFGRLKLEENGADFSDTLHLALELLAKPDGDSFKRTELAEMLSENYKEILVDEYQDVNKAQDMIFSALSKDENNLFMVGDVKQSIYRFRQAMPEIFLGRRDSMKEYSGKNYPAKVTLGKNFRSRKGVTETVNLIFSSLMSREAGGLEYDENEFLEAAADYPEHPEADAEFYLISGSGEEETAGTQARFTADYISKAMAGGMKITGKDGFREPQYRDFCILLRSLKSAPEFINALNEKGIPVSCEAGEGFLTSPEIMLMTSLLKIINNPADDIPLTAVMLSPVFGFLPDDLAIMRSAHREGSIWQALNAYAESGNEKAVSFLAALTALRRLSATLRTGELVRRLVSEFGAIICASGNSVRKKANLNRFIDLSNKTDGKGVSGFVKYIDRLIASGKDVEENHSVSEAADAVRIMTIHKSKGLEFPVCILGMCEKKYNDSFLREDLIIAPESGIGISINDGSVKYDTLPRLAAKIETKAAEHSEELRVLYVALTRAKEKLVMLCSCSNPADRIFSAAKNIRREKLIDPFTVSNFSNYAIGIISALLRHPDANNLREEIGFPYKYVLPSSTKLKAEIVYMPEKEETEKMIPDSPKADEKLVEEIRTRAEFVYPFASLESIVAKRIASKLDAEDICGEYFASAKPSFISKGKLTPAQRGTATHRFMQFADYAKAKADIKSELSRLVSDGMLTELEADAVDIKAISEFFDSSLAARMLSAEKIYKEYSFTASIPLCEMHPDIPETEGKNEVIIIEGVADCAFEEDGRLVIVDYKTDRASPEELKEKYKEQLGIYKRCLAETIGLPVKEAIIYSFRSGAEIRI